MQLPELQAELNAQHTRSVNDTQNLTGTYFKVTYMVTGYEWFSEASMKFATSEGVHIWIVQGNAWALDDASPVPTQICSTDMECARFRVEGIIKRTLEEMHSQMAELRCEPQPHSPCGMLIQGRDNYDMRTVC